LERLESGEGEGDGVAGMEEVASGSEGEERRTSEREPDRLVKPNLTLFFSIQRP
jgi:hypothetical protein